LRRWLRGGGIAAVPGRLRRGHPGRRGYQNREGAPDQAGSRPTHRSAIERPQRVDAHDLAALADITLPIPNPQPLSYQVDSQRNVANTENCETALRAKFGAPVFEDSALIAFRVGGAQPAATARAR
jgi:hypothetical protein